MKKRTLLIIALLLLIVIAISSYFFFFKKDLATPTQESGDAFPSGSEDVVGFPQSGVGGQQGGEGTGVEDIDTALPTPQLRKITANPTASAVIIPTEEGAAIRYVAKETGHVFEAFTTSTLIERIANTTIPRIQEALFSHDGENLILRYLSDDRETIETFLGTIERDTDTPEIEGSLVGTFLPQNISAFDINDSSTSLFYITPTESGSEGVETNIEGEGAARIFTHPLQEWSALYTANNDLVLTTNPSANIPGFLYSVNKSGSFTRLLSDVNGLVARINPDNNIVLFSESVSNSITLNTLDIETGERTILPIRTIAEKCVWSTQEENIIYCAASKTITPGDYPDIWYQGRISFSDALLEINTEAQTIKLLSVPEEVSGEAIDVIELTISPDGSLLVFVNKKDSSLWSLTLPQEEVIDLDEEE